ncbi:MAG: hypothetical protein NTY96_12825 [Bacteroidetes bacterium]|nr:hypothetical protein [Bacteroidota bacterium]
MRNIMLKLNLIILALFLLQGISRAQTKAEIQNIDFNVVGDSLIVTYDLLKAKNSEKFNVVLVVKTVTGKSYDPLAVAGDVGGNIFGGKAKRIVWNIAKDKVVINDEIFVQVLATPMPSDITATPVQETPKQTQQPKTQGGEKVFSKGGAIALSAIMPGLGITKLRAGGAYWLIGLATYGLAIGGVVLNVMAPSTYNKYKDATSASDRDTYYKKAVSQNKTGNTLLYLAGGLWFVDMIITAAVPAKRKSGYSLGPTYDPVINQPMLTFRYRIGKK